MLLLARCRSARAGGSSAPRAVVLVRGLVKGLTLSTQLQYPNPPPNGTLTTTARRRRPPATPPLIASRTSHTGTQSSAFGQLSGLFPD